MLPVLSCKVDGSLKLDKRATMYIHTNEPIGSERVFVKFRIYADYLKDLKPDENGIVTLDGGFVSFDISVKKEVT